MTNIDSAIEACRKVADLGTKESEALRLAGCLLTILKAGETDMAKIAEKHLGLSTLATRNTDAEDFSQQSVWAIKAALEEAFAAGFTAGKEAR